MSDRRENLRQQIKDYNSTKAKTNRLKERIAELEAELEKYSEYTICDCCQSLTLEPVDAGGHMQCVSCTKLAELEVDVALAKRKHQLELEESRRLEQQLAALKSISLNSALSWQDKHIAAFKILNPELLQEKGE